MSDLQIARIVRKKVVRKELQDVLSTKESEVKKNEEVSSVCASGVERITIIFTLDHDYNEVVLRLARTGAETAVVTVDGKRTHLVTNSMLGSNEGYVFGAYNLTLGALPSVTF